MAQSELLARYARDVYRNWSPEWRVEEIMGPPERLCESLGDGLIAFLAGQFEQRARHEGRAAAPPPLRIVTKTPSVENLSHFFSVFPRAYLLIIVRDGRAIVESGAQSFGWRYESAMHAWDAAGRAILRFAHDTDAAAHRYMIVRYEDVFREMEKTMREVLSFTGLDTARYDFEAAANAPVRGSCELRDGAESGVDWAPVAKPEGFDPTRRWRRWGRRRHERFNRIAGETLERLGYTRQTFRGNRLFWAGCNAALDVKWALATAAKRMAGRALRVLSTEASAR